MKRKFLSIFSVFLFSLALTALVSCSKKQQTSGGSTGSGSTTTTTTTTTVTASSSSAPSFQGLKDGVHQGSAAGRNGDVVVEIDVKNGKIVSTKVVSEAETDFAKPAEGNIINSFMSGKNLDQIDATSGATITSKATKDAIQNAIDNASGKASSQVLYANTSTDVVVIGAGGAGMAASIKARETGAKVILVEKMGITGGNTTSATGGLNASETKYQEALGIEDSDEQYYEDTMKGGYYKNDPELVHTLTEEAKYAVDWLISLGADLSDVGKMAGSTNSRTHRPKGGAAVGAHLVPVLEKACKEKGVDLRLNNTATSILHDGNKVTGVLVKDKNGNTYTINAKAVVLATGGFGANNDLVASYRPDLKGFSTTNHKGATGDGIALAQGVNADFVDMGEIQTHPTVVKDSGVMITEAVRGNGAILINKEGKRFTNEMLTRDVVSTAILKQPGGSAYIFFDQSVRESLKAIEGYAKNGLLTEGKSLEELASKLGMNPAVLKATVENYNSYQKSGNDSEFGRKHSEMPRALATPPYYVCEIVPAVHHTMGGVKINSDAEVINTNGEIIEGFYAAGEVTGGVHGGNRLGGNAVADIIVFGEIAGENAAEYALR